MTEKLVIIGNGMAPGRMLEHLLDREPGRYRITIFNAEPRVNYDRIMLSPVLSGEKDYEEIIIHDDGWYIKNSIALYKGHKIIAIDRAAKTVVSDQGALEAYDKLVIATGSMPLIIPVPGHDLPGVLTYRDLDDVNAMLIAAQSRDKAVVIGGGLLGLEAAAGLAARGMDVTVLHLMPTLMERQLDPAAGYLLKRAVEERGIKVVTKANTRAILGKDRVEGVRLADGTIIPATLVVMASGIRPCAGLARDAGLAVNRGILVDAGMRTSDADILAIGECAEVGGHVYGVVAPVYEMARVAAAQLCGDGAASFVHNDTPTKLKVTGIELFSLGDFVDEEDRQEIALRDAAAGVYKRLMIKDNRIIGAVLFGETSDGAWFSDLKNKEVDISEMRDTLIFGQAYQGGSPLDPMAAVAALPDDAEICGCNGVCKSDRRLGRSGGVKTMNRIAIGSTTDIPPRGARCVATPRGEVAVFRTAEDLIFAVEDRRPHKGGPLSQRIVHGAAVTCPLHNWVVSLETGRGLGAEKGPVRTIPLEREGERPFLALDALAYLAA